MAFKLQALCLSNQQIFFILCLNLVQLLPPSPGSIHSINSWGSTPKTASRFIDVGHKVALLRDMEYSAFYENLNLLIKGSISMVYYVEALHTELDSYTKASREWLERSNASKHCIQIGGIVSSALLSKMQRYDNDLDPLKEQMRWRVKWKPVMIELADCAIQQGIIVKRSRKSRTKVEK